MREVLIKALQSRELYSHPVTQFEVIQTHLSWVILTGDYAYKIKKPLNLGFQDFTTLAKRKYYCDLEVLLNKRLAPNLYLGVIPITGTATHPQLETGNNPIEYAIKMHQFPQTALLSALVKKNQITKEMIENIAIQLAEFHMTAQICASTLFGTPNEVFSPMQENFRALAQLPAGMPYAEKIQLIETWAKKTYTTLKPLLIKRKEQGFIRACHGDLHLGNIVLIDRTPVIFDCIEFNENFRWTDLFNDVSFLAMDLDHFNLPELSNAFINTYLENTLDFEGLLLLKFYQCYRAMVRAKVSALQINQLKSEEGKDNLQKDLASFFHLSEKYTLTKPPQLTVTMGVSGSGKSHYTEALLMKTGAIRLRSDIIRKKMLKTQSPHLRYSEQMTKEVYLRLQAIAHSLLVAGHSVIIDATCLKKWQRQLFFSIAKQLKISIQLLFFDAPKEILLERIAHRLANRQDPSEADEKVLALQLKELESLTDIEKPFAKIISPANNA